MSDFIDEDLLKDWFEEAYSQVAEMESHLLVLENDTSNQEAVDAIFRAAHTLKGGSATVQMDEISKFTHTLEDAMDEIRSGKVKVDSAIVDVLLNALDIIKNMIESRSSGNVYKGDHSKTINDLKKIAEHKTEKTPKKAPEQAKPAKVKDNVAQPDDSVGAKVSEYDILEFKSANKENLPLYKVVIVFDETNPMRTVGGIQVFTALRDLGHVIKTYPDFEELYSDDFHKEVTYIVASGADPETIVKYTAISDTTVEQHVVSLDGSAVGFSVKGDAGESRDDVPVVAENEYARPEVEETAKDIDAINDEISIAKSSAEPDSDDTSDRKKQIKDNPKQITSSVLRVDSSRIDDLLNLVSEIVINKATFNQVNSQFIENLELLNYTLSNYKDKIKHITDTVAQKDANIKKELQKDFAGITTQYDQFASQYKGIIERFKSTTQNLDRISADLREGVMRVRMIQIKQIFSRFPRLVRDLSRDLKKDIELVIEGEETEVDKAMLDDLIDPLIHCVRNSVDHGIESPEDRLKAGKKDPGVIKLTALNEGNLISIYVSDNGRGIDVEKVRKKAVSLNLISADKVLKDQDVYALLFEPGFSTAEKVTSVSGRGVGLDVVKRNIEKLSGSIRITSNPGKGTTFAIKLPLTLAIIQGLMVKVQEEIYALPISSVLESIRITPDEIKSIDNYEVINVRDDVLSLLRLSRLFNIGGNEDREFYFVVIVGVGDKKMGLLVDLLIGEEDIVIKPLKDKYTSTPGIAGATVLGDGTVSLILDVSQLIELGLKKRWNTTPAKVSPIEAEEKNERCS